MKRIIFTLMFIFLISFASAEWIEGTNVKVHNIQLDYNVEMVYDLQPDEFSFNITSPSKFDLALEIEDNSNIEFTRNKDGVFEEVKEKKITFREGWCEKFGGFCFGKQDEDPDKAKYRIRFLGAMSPFKIFAGTGTLISEVEVFNFKYYEDSDSDRIKFESEELIDVRDVIRYKS